MGKTKEVSSVTGDFSPNIQRNKVRRGKERERKRGSMTDDRKKDEQTAVRDSDRDHQLSHTYSRSSSPRSPHLSIITPFQHHCISLHHSITHQIIYKPPFIHLSLSISAIALSLPICSSISLPSGSHQSVSSILFMCVCHICVYWDINLSDNVNSKRDIYPFKSLNDEDDPDFVLYFHLYYLLPLSSAFINSLRNAFIHSFFVELQIFQFFSSFFFLLWKLDFTSQVKLLMQAFSLASQGFISASLVSS